MSERILYFTGKINEIHEVKGTDEVGATMDSMDLEREKGITIQSAATFCEWKGHHINLIDTPGHVDFTIEVERALRVLDGAIMILCAIGGVQSQSITVDRQMKRYNVPRICFINKLDRIGADPWSVVKQLKSKLGLNAVAVQIPMGTENNLQGIVDLIEMKAYYFKGKSGESVEAGEIPDYFRSLADEKRAELLEKLAELDVEIEEKYLMDEIPSENEIRLAIRRQTLSHKFIPVFMGSAKGNVGVQLLLDGVLDYLPNPTEVDNFALKQVEENKEEKVLTISDSKAPFLGLAFKLEESQYGQLTYLRIYQGSIKVGDSIYNMSDKKKVKINRLGRMHANKMEDVKELGPGEICALFGITCASGDSFTKNLKDQFTMESMFVPDSVVSLSVRVADKKMDKNFSKALSKFVREDPTFRVTQDPESGETIIHGMGELHLEIYIERMKREYNVEVITGKPYVAYREAIRSRVEFDYLHKKQTGGAGQYAGVKGYFEPMDPTLPEKYIFEDQVVGNSLTPGYIQACEKGFKECSMKGPLVEAPVWGIKVVLQEGQMHSVDSSELAFRLACQGAFRQAFPKASPCILEPIMSVEVTCPTEFQSAVMSSLTRRRATITGSEMSGSFLLVKCDAPLREMFGYISELRQLTQGKGEFSMEYQEHRSAPDEIYKQIVQEYQAKKKIEADGK